MCIWLHETHPRSRPRCSVRPSVSMVINPACSCVDATGLVDLDGLRNWTHVRQSSGTRSQDLPGGEEAPGRSWSSRQVLELQAGPGALGRSWSSSSPWLLYFLSGKLLPLAVGVRDGADVPEGHAPLLQVCCGGSRAQVRGQSPPGPPVDRLTVLMFLYQDRDIRLVLHRGPDGDRLRSSSSTFVLQRPVWDTLVLLW